MQALAEQLSDHHHDLDLADIHLLVKRKLAEAKLGLSGARQGAEERSSFLSKLKFSQYKGSHKGTISGGSKGLSFTLNTPGPSKPVQPIRPVQPVKPVTPTRVFTTSASPTKPLTFSEYDLKAYFSCETLRSIKYLMHIYKVQFRFIIN